MLKEYKNFLTEEECDSFISLYDDDKRLHQDDNIYKFYHTDLRDKVLPTDKLDEFIFSKFRVQMVDITIQQIEQPHGHSVPWSIVVFLNSNFIGGEIIFGNLEFKPVKGTMLYFTGDQRHKVNNCFGKRYTLVGFLQNNPMKLDADHLT